MRASLLHLGLCIINASFRKALHAEFKAKINSVDKKNYKSRQYIGYRFVQIVCLRLVGSRGYPVTDVISLP